VGVYCRRWAIGHAVVRACPWLSLSRSIGLMRSKRLSQGFEAQHTHSRVWRLSRVSCPQLEVSLADHSRLTMTKLTLSRCRNLTRNGVCLPNCLGLVAASDCRTHLHCTTDSRDLGSMEKDRKGCSAQTVNYHGWAELCLGFGIVELAQCI